MARVNQGKYKIIKKYEGIKKEYNELVPTYYEDVDTDGEELITQWNTWEGNDCWDLFGDTSNLWLATIDLVNEIEILLTSQKFESSDKEEEYKERIRILKQIEYNLVELYREVYDATSSGMSGKEQEWLLYNELYKRRIQ